MWTKLLQVVGNTYLVSTFQTLRLLPQPAKLKMKKKCLLIWIVAEIVYLFNNYRDPAAYSLNNLFCII